MDTYVKPNVLTSVMDGSVNFVFDNGQEARYVRRTDDYIIVYISSHSGCDRACRMCHLTQTGQTKMVPATVSEMCLQAGQVLHHYSTLVEGGKEPPAKRIHFNWMARGEPLLNPHLVDEWDELTQRLQLMVLIAMGESIKISYKVSTIMPADGYNRDNAVLRYLTQQDLKKKLLKLVSGPRPADIYHSVYSMDDSFRKRWLPKSMHPEDVFPVLADVQRETNFSLSFHWAYIEGENDSAAETQLFTDAVVSSGLVAKFNLVRYNPYSEVQGKESSERVLQRNFNAISAVMMRPGSRIVPRVGFDVAASCGCFVESSTIPTKSIQLPISKRKRHGSPNTNPRSH